MASVTPITPARSSRAMETLFSLRKSLLVLWILHSEVARASPPGFPASGNGLWYKQPGSIWSRHYLPVGNGYLAAMTPGGTSQETTQLNIESLWSGGPFADSVGGLPHTFNKIVNLRLS